MRDVKIQIVDEETFEKVLPLISAYQRFYRVEPDETRNRAHFGQFLRDHSRGILLAAFDESGEAIGFSTLYFVPSSLSAQMTCTFNDLYISPGARRESLGYLLGFRSALYARDHGYPRMSWMTELDNKAAQQLYDLAPATRSAWYVYDMPLQNQEQAVAATEAALVARRGDGARAL